MSVSDLGLVFASVICIVFVFHCVHYCDYQEIQMLQTQYNLAVDQAVEAAFYDVAEYDLGQEVMLNQEEVIHNFFQALYVNLGIMEEPMKKELCKSYIPYIMIVERDGITPFIHDSSKGDELVSFQNGQKVYFQFDGEQGDILQVTLTNYVVYRDALGEIQMEGYYNDIVDKLPLWFSWDISLYEEKKRGLIISLIEQCTNECITKQNQFAKQYGIKYNFMLPTIDYDEWYRTINDISLIVVFQGYPYGNSITGRYNRVAIGGARMHKVDVA